jgi:hypothetical protein
MKIGKVSKRFQRRGRGSAPAADAKMPAKELASGPALIASAFGKLNVERRARLLGRLLGSVGPLALVVVGGGVFAKYLRNARWREVPISFEDAARATSSQVHDLVRYVEQSNPHLVDGLLATLLQDGVMMTALGASVAAITVKRLSRRGGWRQGSALAK